MSTPPIRPIRPSRGAIPPVTPIMRRRPEEHERGGTEDEPRRRQPGAEQFPPPADAGDGHIDVIA